MSLPPPQTCHYPDYMMPEAIAQRLRELTDTPQLSVTVEGGGVPKPHTVGFDYLVVVARNELVEMACRLEDLGKYVQSLRGQDSDEALKVEE